MEQRYIKNLLEEMRSKFELVLEGHTALHAKIDEYRRESNGKHDLTAFKLDVITGQLKAMNSKIDSVAANLAAHRADTEAHPSYLVRE